MTDHEKEVIQQMLVGVITHWSAIGKTSIKACVKRFCKEKDIYSSKKKAGNYIFHPQRSTCC
jgi:hypothetical protein